MASRNSYKLQPILDSIQNAKMAKKKTCISFKTYQFALLKLGEANWRNGLSPKLPTPEFRGERTVRERNENYQGKWSS